MCRDYVDEGKPQKTDDDKFLYKTCCVQSSFCEVWAQTWFWILIGCIILALIVLSVVGCVLCCCCRKRLCCGADKMNDVEVENPKIEDFKTQDSNSSQDSPGDSSSDSE
ncbi:hypothetical protein L3Y34_019791 [Caenorhabditis briggsae]|uniref:Uncharacterized protein n=1 Tax=Caenorhabditis briggsae TaxID=6238 RepID=A0AAE9DPX6_CAEBR|nr:hypothetical protein L3Y34_019791 [Caenorhabditis briggsae]